MELSDGYKNTDMGVIPSDWNTPTLREILYSTQLGGNYKNNLSETNWPLIKMGNLGRGTIKLDKLMYIDPSEIPAIKDRLKLFDVLFNTRNTLELVGKVSIWRDELPEAYFNSNIMRLEFNNKVSSNLFINYILNTPKTVSMLRGIATGTTSVAAIYTRDLVNLKIVLPPEIEQIAISDALSGADAMIDSLEKLIEKKRQIKQGAMQELLTGKKRLPGFSYKWSEREIREVVQTPVTDGPHLTPIFVADGIPFLSVNNIVSNQIDTSDLRFISKLDDDIFSRKCKPKKGDILLGKAASVGKVALVENDWDFNIWSPIALIRLKPQHSSKFVYYQLQSEYVIKQITLLTNSSSQGNIGMGDIEKIKLKLPELEEQLEIEKIFSEIDFELCKLKEKLNKARQIKQGMMQQLLTGRIRLV